MNIFLRESGSNTVTGRQQLPKGRVKIAAEDDGDTLVGTLTVAASATGPQHALHDEIGEPVQLDATGGAGAIREIVYDSTGEWIEFTPSAQSADCRVYVQPLSGPRG